MNDNLTKGFVMKKSIALLIFIMAVSSSCVSTNESWSNYRYKETNNYKEEKKAAHKYKHLSCKKSKKNKHKKKHKKSLPPGLQKKVARGGSLPPGWQKKIKCGEVLEASIYGNSVILDIDEYPSILDYNPAAEVIRVHDRIIRIMKDTHEVLDIIERL